MKTLYNSDSSPSTVNVPGVHIRLIMDSKLDNVIGRRLVPIKSPDSNSESPS